MFGASPIEVVAREAMRAGWIYCESYTYTARFLAGTASALGATNVQTVPVTITNGWDFVIQQYLGTWYNADGTTLNAAPRALVQFTKDTSDKLLSSAPVDWLNVFGSFAANKFPNSLSTPVLLSQKSTFQVQLTNLTADAPARVEIAFPGFKIYYKTINGKTISREQLFGIVY